MTCLKISRVKVATSKSRILATSLLVSVPHRKEVKSWNAYSPFFHMCGSTSKRWFCEPEKLVF